MRALLLALLLLPCAARAERADPFVEVAAALLGRGAGDVERVVPAAQAVRPCRQAHAVGGSVPQGQHGSPLVVLLQVLCEDAPMQVVPLWLKLRPRHQRADRGTTGVAAQERVRIAGEPSDGVALGSAGPGEVVQVLHLGTGATLRARVLAAGSVERLR